MASGLNKARRRQEKKKEKRRKHRADDEKSRDQHKASDAESKGQKVTRQLFSGQLVDGGKKHIFLVVCNVNPGLMNADYYINISKNVINSIKIGAPVFIDLINRGWSNDSTLGSGCSWWS